MSILGNVERFDNKRISGWISVRGADDGKPVVEVLCDGVVVASGCADRPREDLRLAGHGDCAFEIFVPQDYSLRRLRVRLQDTDLYLTHPSLFGEHEAAPLRSSVTRNGTKVFVSGPARSGTSILFHALQHTLNLPGTGEGHILPLYQSLLYKFYTYVAEFRDQSGVLASHLDFAAFEELLVDDVRRLYEKLFPSGRFIDKTPGHQAIESIRIARLAFPECKIIILRRNGLDVVNSFVTKFNAGFNEACAEWRDSVRATFALRELFPDIFILEHFFVRTRPEEAAAAIAQYLDSPEVGSAIGAYFRENDVDKLSVGNGMTPTRLGDMNWCAEQRLRFAEICRAEMLACGYEM